MSYNTGIGDLKQVINSIAPKSTSETQQVAPGPKDSSSPTVPQTLTDEARLSSTGGLISQALEGSDVRTDKVAALQQAIANGTYNVSAADVAEKMVRSLLD
jgi:negative regulator of flagellin synthesis FlgM